MRGRNLLVLALVVLVLGAYILLYERHQMTTEEALEKADRVFPTLESDDVTRIALTTADGSFLFDRDGDGWRLVEPIDYPADSSRVSSLLSAVVDLSFERVLEETEVDGAAYGLDEPDLSVVLTTDGEELHLAVGDETPLGSNRAVSTGGPDIMLVRSWFTSSLEHSLDDWRSRDVVDLSTDQVASLEITSGDDRVRAVHEGETWRLEEPVTDLADREHFRNLVSDLNGLEIKEFLDPAADLGRLGLDPPNRRVSVIRTDNAGTTVLEMGATRQQNDATEVACRRDGAELFWISDRAETALDRAPVRWRSSVIYPFDSWDVRSVTITDAQGASAGALRDDGLWSMSGGSEADTTEILDRLDRLSRLQAIDFDLLTAGTAPQGSVLLELGDVGEGSAEHLEFRFFAPMAAGGRALVEVSGRDTVMSVEPEEIEAILGSLEKLRRPEPTPTAPTVDDEAAAD